MTILQTIILATIEGLTEFIPISSTGHLILAEHFLQIPSTEFVKSFDIIIQLGAILSVVFLYWQKIISSKHLWKSTLIAFLPTGILGLTLYRLVKDYLIGNVLITSLSLLLGGIVLLVIDKWLNRHSKENQLEKLSTPKLLNIGLYQSISMVPGVSRSAASIIGGVVSGLSKKEAVEFSFLLAIPTMLSATGYDLLKTGFSFSRYELLLLAIGFIVAFFSALIAVKAFIAFVTNHDFKIFAIYRILLAIIVFLTFMIN